MYSKYSSSIPIRVNIRKPIWSGDGVCEVGIRDKYIRKALATKRKLCIMVPQGSVIMTPKAFMKNATMREKVFKFPDNPMKLWYAKIYLDKKRKIEDVSIPLDVKERLREIWIEKYA